MASFVTVTADPSAAADDVQVSDSPVSSIALALNQNFDALCNRIGKCNYTASGTPGVGDDSGAGYSVGSRWLYAGMMFECSDASSGAAVWTQYTGTGKLVRDSGSTFSGITYFYNSGDIQLYLGNASFPYTIGRNTSVDGLLHFHGYQSAPYVGFNFETGPVITQSIVLGSATTPSSPYTGQIYFDGTHFQGWNGSAWKQLDN